MANSIAELHTQLETDIEATDRFLLAALARGDEKAVSTWQKTLAAAKAAHAAVGAYLAALAE